MELPLKYFFIALLWILWCAFHSTLITITVTDYVKRKFGQRYRFYRLFFNIISLITFAPLFFYSISHKGPLLFHWEGPLLIIKYFLLLLGLYLFVAGAKNYSMSQFFGIHQIRTGQIGNTLLEYDAFDTSGILNVIRHPWYAGGIIIIWSSDIYTSTLLNNIVVSAYFVVGSFLEERKLLLEFGDKYREYQRNVPMLLPYKWFVAKLKKRHICPYI
jgi:methanethiol S-methyltransferase